MAKINVFCFNVSMNLLGITSINQNISGLSDWIDSTPTSQVIDSVTYDVYESNNPFRHKFSKKTIKNDFLRGTANMTTSVGAEIFSVFTNPYYLTHKIVKLPVMYQDVVSAYKGNSDS